MGVTILEYVISRVRECTTELRSTKFLHRKMALLAQLIRELQSMDRLPFDIASLFETEVAICFEMPSQRQMLLFFAALDELNKADVPDTQYDLSSFGLGWYELKVSQVLP